jgi:2-succinyl-6-hydroxy-2,4-cyclohexadiene-1-carboxylate synthase
VLAKGLGAPEALVLLHGFGGTRRMWDDVAAHLDRKRYRPLALDLPGHGQASAHERPITFDGCVAAVLDASPERFALCGYSMGGRIALHVALAAPERVSRLILIASSPGIEDEHERAQRRAADRRLADELEHGSFADFAKRWNAQPLFAEDPPAVLVLAREDQDRNAPRSLAAAMRGLGVGEMSSLWGRIGGLRIPVAILVGDRDAKFCALAVRMQELLPNSCELTLLPGGHRLPLESPSAVARELSRSSGDGIRSSPRRLILVKEGEN